LPEEKPSRTLKKLREELGSGRVNKGATSASERFFRDQNATLSGPTKRGTLVKKRQWVEIWWKTSGEPLSRFPEKG